MTSSNAIFAAEPLRFTVILSSNIRTLIHSLGKSVIFPKNKNAISPMIGGVPH
jgi:hypothetical protein